MRAHLVVVVAMLLAAACGAGRTDDSPLGRAKRLFGSKMSVSPAGIDVPGARVFVAVPDPVPPDYDGYSAALITDDGKTLRDAEAVRFAWEHGVKDPEPLARVSALFLTGSRFVANEEDRTREYIRGREGITSPVIDGGRLVFWQVRGSMAPTAEKVTVDLTTFQATRAP
jgi:hypothetical protein